VLHARCVCVVRLSTVRIEGFQPFFLETRPSQVRRGAHVYAQLCINFANEKLQRMFTEAVFESVLAEYQKEGINVQEMAYEDNAAVVSLIEVGCYAVHSFMAGRAHSPVHNFKPTVLVPCPCASNC
jgi:hypothetical protein